MTKTELPPDVIEARAEAARNAVRTRRVLREYAGKLHAIADRRRACHRLSRGLWAGVDAAEVVALLRRRRVIASAVELFCRAASGMVDDGAMERQAKAELLLRLREVENALDEVKLEAEAIQKRFPEAFPAKLLEDVGLPDLRTVRYAAG